MTKGVISYLSIGGVIAGIAMLSFSAFRYSGDVHWSRVTVSLLCAQQLPNGEANPGRQLPIAALLLLCASMAALFELISRHAQSGALRSTIQIAGIGSMVYALLTATPIHNLMVNIANAFYAVAILAIVYMLIRRRSYALLSFGIGCIALNIVGATAYYTDTLVDAWGIIQKVTFLLTTGWLIAVHLCLGRHPHRDSAETGATW